MLHVALGDVEATLRENIDQAVEVEELEGRLDAEKEAGEALTKELEDERLMNKRLTDACEQAGKTSDDVEAVRDWLEEREWGEDVRDAAKRQVDTLNGVLSKVEKARLTARDPEEVPYEPIDRAVELLQAFERAAVMLAERLKREARAAKPKKKRTPEDEAPLTPPTPLEVKRAIRVAYIEKRKRAAEAAAEKVKTTEEKYK